MNVLILTGKFGMGHVKCAEAVCEEICLSMPDASVTTVDVMDYLFPHFSKAIYKGFSVLVTRLPGMYNLLNRAAGRHGGIPLKKAIAGKLDRLLADVRPDLIISNLPVCSKYVSAYKELRVCPQPLFTYITDITVHEEWIADKTDLYFVGDAFTKDELIARGVQAEKVVVSGIPVKKAFRYGCAASAQADAGFTPKNHGDSKKMQLLIMGGGLGLIPGGRSLLKRLNDEEKFSVTLIAGKNPRLERQARRKYENIRVIGFTDRIHEYMSAADLILTKPGGITTFEAMASRTPLYVVDPFLEQEMENARFIESKKIGKVVQSSGTDIAADMIELMNNSALIKSMKDNMERLSGSFVSADPLRYLDCFARSGADSEPAADTVGTAGAPAVGAVCMSDVIVSPGAACSRPAIMLTFDDGPDPSYTGQLLDLLDSYDVKAAFFTVGSFAAANPRLIERMKEGGHTIGIHSHTHRSAYLMSPAQTKRDFDMSAAAFRNLGIVPRFYRPPWGHTTPALRQAAADYGMMPVYWSVMAQDWQANTHADEIASRLLARTVPGSIVCLHDGRGRSCAPKRTIEALRKVLPVWIDQGYRFVTPEEVYRQ